MASKVLVIIMTTYPTKFDSASPQLYEGLLLVRGGTTTQRLCARGLISALWHNHLTTVR